MCSRYSIFFFFSAVLCYRVGPPYLKWTNYTDKVYVEDFWSRGNGDLNSVGGVSGEGYSQPASFRVCTCVSECILVFQSMGFVGKGRMRCIFSINGSSGV